MGVRRECWLVLLARAAKSIRLRCAKPCGVDGNRTSRSSADFAKRDNGSHSRHESTLAENHNNMRHYLDDVLVGIKCNHAHIGIGRLPGDIDLQLAVALPKRQWLPLRQQAGRHDFWFDAGNLADAAGGPVEDV